MARTISSFKIQYGEHLGWHQLNKSFWQSKQNLWTLTASQVLELGSLRFSHTMMMYHTKYSARGTLRLYQQYTLNTNIIGKIWRLIPLIPVTSNCWTKIFNFISQLCPFESTAYVWQICPLLQKIKNKTLGPNWHSSETHNRQQSSCSAKLGSIRFEKVKHMSDVLMPQSLPTDGTEICFQDNDKTP